MKIRVTKQFSWARDGIHVETYQPGEHDVPERCAEVAIENDWARAVAAKKAPAPKKAEAPKKAADSE